MASFSSSGPSDPFDSSRSGSSNPFAGPSVAVIRDIPIAERVPYDLLDHVDGTIDLLAMPHDPEWLAIDATIIRWFYQTVSNDIFRTVVRDGDSAPTVWAKITGLFTDNEIQRVTFLQQEFFGTHQNDYSLDEYVLKLKSLSDELHDLEFPIDDKIMLSTLSAGLSENLSNAASNLTLLTTPSFEQAVAYLRLEERRLNHLRARAAHTAFVAGLSCGRSDRAMDRPSRRPDRSNRPPDLAVVETAVEMVAPTPPPPRLVHLSTPPPLRHGSRVTIRGPGSFMPTPCPCRALPTRASWGRVRPPTRLSMRHPNPPRPTPPPSSASWDPALLSALQSVPTAGAYGGGDWFMDTGASAHMAAHPGAPPAYDDLRIFGCRCYPSTAATAAHKLAPRSLPCVFLGYPANTKGYRCYDPVSHRVLTSRHVYFDELVFPFQQGLLATPTTMPPAPAGPLVAGPARRRLIAAASSAPAPPGPSASLSPAVPPAPPSPAPSAVSSSPASSAASSPASLLVAAAPAPMLTRARAGVRRPSTRYPADQYVCTTSPSAATAFWASGNSVLPHDGGGPSFSEEEAPPPSPTDPVKPGSQPPILSPGGSDRVTDRPNRCPGRSDRATGRPSRRPGQSSRLLDRAGSC
ncbi:hypothetical protein QYE76_044020 [Lolium multiflorum]|uniref:Retroviral polymerase SH3-like domain-containing protein n=1 Tax=Lolium multiflorum TaxID=4521 RepID=A0AAD8TJW4_LOLMU|nr:hypothetical protein QYE76_044020 [Lolium multiflorum]